MTATATDCPSTGRLRTHLDDPSPQVEAHLDDCPECRDVIVDLAGNAGLARQLITALAPAPDEDAAHPSPTLAPAASRRGRPDRPWVGAGRPRRTLAPRRHRVTALPAMTALVLAAALVLTPSGRGAVAQLLDTFRGERLEVVAVDLDTVGDLSALAGLGEVQHEDVVLPEVVEDPAEAARISGLDPVEAAPLQDALAASDTRIGYLATPGGAVVLTLQARPDNGVPAELDGSTLHLQVPAVVATILAEPTGTGAAHPLGDVPRLVAAGARAPEVTADGAPLADVRDFLLSREELPQGFRDQLAGIEDWQHTLPLPVPTGSLAWDEVTVGGAQGVAFGDDSGLAAAVVWQDDGLIRGLAGPQPRSVLLEVAGG